MNNLVYFHLGQILDKCQLGNIVRRSPKKLDSAGNVPSLGSAANCNRSVQCLEMGWLLSCASAAIFLK
jgi:hypothetical protein